MNYVPAKQVFRQPDARRGLPGWTYHSAELHGLELEQIFLRHWMFVAHAAEIPRSGDYACFALGDERAVIVRDGDGEIRAFHNVCRHRASRVVADDRGHCGKAFICPFHGWSYNLDGTLRNVPKAETFPDIDRAELGLKPIDCEIWHGLVFIRFAGDGPGVAEQFAPAEKEIDLYRIGEMQPYGNTWSFRFDLDWKAVADIDAEGYHVPVGHPELFDLVGSTYTDQTLEGGLARACGDFAGRRHKLERNREYVAALPDDSYLPEDYRTQWIYWGLFPGFVLTLFPDQVEVYQIYPTGPQRSVMAGASYALPDDRPAMQRARELNRKINRDVGNEDVDLVKWAAEGMRSSAFDGVILSDLEINVASYQNRLRKLLPVVRLDEAPAAGTLREVNARLAGERRVTAVR